MIGLLEEAASLLSERGENPEYDRAISELSCAIIGISTEHKDAVLTFLRSIRL